MGDASGMYTSPTGARPQNGGAGQGQGNNEGFANASFQLDDERLRRVMMGHENFDDMCERYQDAKAAGDNVDDPKLYTVKPVRPPNG